MDVALLDDDVIPFERLIDEAEEYEDVEEAEDAMDTFSSNLAGIGSGAISVIGALDTGKFDAFARD